ncbi:MULTISPECIES: FMN-binding protein MioC [Alishewanella]|uniref:Flavodoxin/nitric oxide synthase n=1 Tax=Alishewanella jeotgali KCTC 22429 TaxID=1129374 RepID=H3ZEM0_9ALTE|nr:MULTISPECIES: FMN-binding protein MioC [Alishewanella]EHR40983.1 flavodoxin/nitric oxide synthase [Alishewanella jeotgali KCTC 22429]OCW97023.1 FMN-binding protein MioC [Alishewanella sp. HH-ZS]
MIEILVGSQMGAAEYVAEQVAETLVQAGYDVTTHLKPELNQLNQHAIWLVITSTYGAGDLPDNIQPFADQLAQDQGDLTTLSYAVITLGDSSYDTFCLAGAKIAALLQLKGARCLLPGLDIDAQDPELPEDQALVWLPQFINSLSGSTGAENA